MWPLTMGHVHAGEAKNSTYSAYSGPKYLLTL